MYMEFAHHQYQFSVYYAQFRTGKECYWNRHKKNGSVNAEYGLYFSGNLSNYTQ